MSDVLQGSRYEYFVGVSRSHTLGARFGAKISYSFAIRVGLIALASGQWNAVVDRCVGVASVEYP